MGCRNARISTARVRRGINVRLKQRALRANMPQDIGAAHSDLTADRDVSTQAPHAEASAGQKALMASCNKSSCRVKAEPLSILSWLLLKCVSVRKGKGEQKDASDRAASGSTCINKETAKGNKTHNKRITQHCGAFTNDCCRGKAINITYPCARVRACVQECERVHVRPFM